MEINKVLDLRGVVCPHTYTKSRLAMDGIEPGELIQIIVDHLPAIESVPRSLEKDGHEVIKVDQLSDTDWEIIARKTGEGKNV